MPGRRIQIPGDGIILGPSWITTAEVVLSWQMQISLTAVVVTAVTCMIDVFFLSVANVLICKITDWSRPRGWTVLYTLSQQTQCEVCLSSHSDRGNDQRGVVHSRREVTGADNEAHQLSIGVIGYRYALFSGDELDYNLTSLYIRHLHWCYITGTKGTGKVTANPPGCSTKGELRSWEELGVEPLPTPSNSHAVNCQLLDG